MTMGGQTWAPKMMLTLLSYCYAAGIFGSRHVEQAIEDDPTVRYICARTRPRERDIRQFRRQYRAQIRACLIQILRWVWEGKLDRSQADVRGASYDEREFQHQIDRSAQERIDVATFIDLMERED